MTGFAEPSGPGGDKCDRAAGKVTTARRMGVALTLDLAMPPPDSKSLSSDPTPVFECRCSPDDYGQEGYKLPVSHHLNPTIPAG